MSAFGLLYGHRKEAGREAVAPRKTTLMLPQEKIAGLRRRLYDTLVPLIDRDYVLLELPYYSNVGDLMIWAGEEALLRRVPHRCRVRASFHTFRFPELPDDVIILLQGGGNWGDVWSGEKTPHAFRRRVARCYPHHKIIVFPQTVCYLDERECTADAALFGACDDLTVCVRDSVSYDRLIGRFHNRVLLLPDMAFCIEEERLEPYRRCTQDPRTLFLRREDCEWNEAAATLQPPDPCDVTDWPCMDEQTFCNRLARRMLWRHPKRYPRLLVDAWFRHVHAPCILRAGFRFLGGYSTVYTTRLHTAILALLLHRQCFMIDNSYGKNKNFYETWLTDVDGLQFLEFPL